MYCIISLYKDIILCQLICLYTRVASGVGPADYIFERVSLSKQQLCLYLKGVDSFDCSRLHPLLGQGKKVLNFNTAVSSENMNLFFYSVLNYSWSRIQTMIRIHSSSVERSKVLGIRFKRLWMRQFKVFIIHTKISS